VIATLEFPSSLETLISLLPPRPHLSVDQIIDQHTFLPYFSPFIPEARINQLRQDMARNNGKAIHFRAGVMASRVPIIQSLRFCPKCATADDATFGECYWHRSHQAPAISICPIHEVQLLESNVAPRQTINRQQYVTLEQAIDGSPLPITYSKSPYSLQLAKDTEWLLNTKVKPLHQIRDIYKRMLFELGYCSYDGRIISPARLISALRSYYPANFFQEIGCEYLERNDDWILNLVRSDKSSHHPLMHLVFMQFVRLSASELFSSAIPEPFGQPDWPCLNPVCEHYRTNIIPAVEIINSKYTSGLPIGEFSCRCGFRYRRKGPDNAHHDRLRLDKVSTYGKLWEAALKRLWDEQDVSVRELARTLNVDSNTVKFHAKRLGLSFPRRGPRISNFRPKEKGTIQKRSEPASFRKAWLHLLDTYPDKGIKSLRTLHSRIFTWLYRYDREWLLNHKPHVLRQPAKSDYKRVDWSERDDQLVCLISEKLPAIIASQSKPIRITISYVGRSIGQLALIQKHANKLPRTSKLLSKVVETRADFAIRKIQWAVDILQKEGLKPVRWRIIRTAGIAKQLSEPKVLSILNSICS
jgi:hypothetical protein